jgi:hypothetical protein
VIRVRARNAVTILIVAALAAFVAGGATALPAQADSLPGPHCVTACTATFDTIGSAQTFAVPVGVTQLSATVAGAAGAPPAIAVTNDPTATGGAGGAATIALGTSYAGTTITFGVGGAGDGSYLENSSSVLLAVAGGGGGGGYAGYLDLVGQILGTYPGGNGGSPSAPGVAPGGDAAAFGTLIANGGGGTAAAGTGGTGDASGSNGGATTVVTPTGATLAAGGTGGSLTVGATTHMAGRGGSGYTGGGGGAVQRNVPNGDVPVDVVAPGGGGAGYLDASLTATAGTPNTGAAHVSFTWSFSPTITTTTTTAHPGDTVPATISGLPANVPFTVVFDGSTVISGTSDANGNATTSFAVGNSQSTGKYALTLKVDAATVATSDPVSITAALALTGTDVSPWVPSAAVLLIAAGVLLAAASTRRRRHVS